MAKTTQVVCDYCGVQFDRPKGRANEAEKNGWKQFCQVSCHGAFKSRAVEALCTQCHSPIQVTQGERTKSTSGRFFCSRNCAAVYNNLQRGLAGKNRNPSHEEVQAKVLRAIFKEQNRNGRDEESEISKTVRTKKLTSGQRSKVSEAVVMLRLLLQGFNPFGSVFDGDKTDWLVEVPQTNKVYKVQVKLTCRSAKQGLPSVSLRSSSRKKRYIEGDFDFIVGWDLLTDVCYVWAWNEVEQHKSGITIHPSAVERWDKFLSV